MQTLDLPSLLENYQWQLSLYAAVGIAAVTFVGKYLLLLVPAFRREYARNQTAAC